MGAESVTILQRLFWVFNVLFHQAVAVITVYIISAVFSLLDVNSLSTWHVPLTTLGIVFLMMESLIVFSKDNIYTMYIPRTKKYLIHSSLQVLSTICVTIGISFKIATQDGDHFITTHGILGLTTWIGLWCSVFFGIATSQSQLLKNYIKPSWIKLTHILLGVVTFTLGLVCLGFGMKKTFFESFLSSESKVLAAIITIVFLYIWGLLDTFKNIYSLMRSILGK